jgi:hypothetical protein
MNKENNLYLIVPYFNFCNWKSTRNNLDIFLHKNKFDENVRIVISEGIFNTELKDYSKDVFLHLKFKLNNVFWAKENLINLAIESIPKDWKYLVWCDRDIIFENKNWVNDSITKLSKSDIIQPWSHLNHLDKNLQKISGQFYSMLYTKSNTSEQKRYGHCGMVWGMNSSFYNKIQKILDWQILGGADTTIGFSCGVRDKEKLLELMPSIPMKNLYKEYLNNFDNIKYDYVDGKIYHLYHGLLTNRMYKQRHKILEYYNFDPLKDIKYNENGVIEFTKKKSGLEFAIKNYFIKRYEDS